jgi:hypothetical protein
MTMIWPVCPTPECATPVPDFDACAALQCGRREGHAWAEGSGCGVHFCAWCLQICSDKDTCHEHVRGCSLNPNRFMLGFTFCFYTAPVIRPHRGHLYPPTNPEAWTNVMHELACKRVKQHIADAVPALQQVLNPHPHAHRLPHVLFHRHPFTKPCRSDFPKLHFTTTHNHSLMASGLT